MIRRLKNDDLKKFLIEFLRRLSHKIKDVKEFFIGKGGKFSSKLRISEGMGNRVFPVFQGVDVDYLMKTGKTLSKKGDFSCFF